MSVSYWEKKYYENADIVVLGSGFVGLQTALAIKEKMPKRVVWILDANAPGYGSSLRNAGFACFGNMGEILDDAKTIGLKQACSLYRKRFNGFNLLKNSIGEIAMGYEKTGGFEIFKSTENQTFDEIANQIPAVNKELEDLDTEVFKQMDTSKLGIHALQFGIKTALEGTVQTHLLYNALRKKALSLGIDIISGINVEKMEEKELGKTLLHSNLHAILCRCVVVCTNALAADLVNVNVVPVRGQILVTSAFPSLNWKGLMHWDKGYVYARRLANRILIGGGRNINFEQESTTSHITTAEIQQYLKQFIEDVLAPGEIFSVDYSWAGTMAMGESRLPIVKEEREGLFLAVRMGGMGLALSASVAKEVSELVFEKYI